MRGQITRLTIWAVTKDNRDVENKMSISNPRNLWWKGEMLQEELIMVWTFKRLLIQVNRLEM